PEIDLEEFAESMFQVQDEDINYEDLYESLFLLYSNPININRASKEELSSLFVLSVLQINNLLGYLEQNGEMISLYELQAVPDFDDETIRKILPFIEIKRGDEYGTSGPLLKRMLQEDNNYLILRTDRIFEKQKGYLPTNDPDETRFLGSAAKVYGRVRTNHSKDFSLGFTFEKDAGEQFNWNASNKQCGFDYYSFHFMKENVGKFKKVIVGDYQMQFGQGLLLGAGFNPGKGSETITTVRRSSSGIKPYTSVLESGFMRGAAATYQIKNFEVTTFYSHLGQDANIKNDTTFTDFDEYISSVQQTGFHRTDSELANKDVVTENTFGTNVHFNSTSRNFQSGITFINTSYSIPLVKKPNNYNQFEFRGNSNYNIGGYFNYNWQNFLVFGEGATSKSGGLGMVGGFIGSLSPIVSISMVLRNYQRDFHSFYGNSFGESTRNINESGIYWGLKITPSRKYFFTAYYDKFKFPWLRFRAEAPSQGYEYLARFNYKPKRSLLLYGQYRAESKQLSVNLDEGNLNRLEEGVKRSYLFNMNYDMGGGFSIKSRVQLSDYTLAVQKTKGMAIAQDLNFQMSKFRVSTRFAIIDTDNFENRQYLYEKDVLYAFSIRGISGKAIRNYILLQYKPSKKFNVWLRYARTNFRDAQRIINVESSVLGSGLTQINGNTRSEVKMQVRYRF
ncbi:MAG: helix-hairpin-helix domain-containing protein, partial [Cyclobacteriaceae bacterium]|nr:helix-hairpin-helix domain-containing protein [Cyclobacteriaceae bacterium]